MRQIFKCVQAIWKINEKCNSERQVSFTFSLFLALCALLVVYSISLKILVFFVFSLKILVFHRIWVIFTCFWFLTALMKSALFVCFYFFMFTCPDFETRYKQHYYRIPIKLEEHDFLFCTLLILGETLFCSNSTQKRPNIRCSFRDNWGNQSFIKREAFQ